MMFLDPRKRITLVVLAGLLSTQTALASPLERRASSTATASASESSNAASVETTAAASRSGGPSPWVSVSSGTPVSTITPVVTTINGKATTKNAEPTSVASLIASPSGSAAPVPTGAPPVGHDDAECQYTDGPFKPFCKPTNGSDAWVGDTYLVTWDPRFFEVNSSIIVQLSYVDSHGGGDQAWESDPTDKSWGQISLTMDDSWRQDLDRNNLTVSILNLASKNAEAAKRVPGPTISLIKKPATHYAPGPPTPNPANKGLEIGLPVALGGALLIVCVLFFSMRKTRRLGLGNIMGRRGGYGERQSRRQRMKRAGGKKGQIRLGEGEVSTAHPEDGDDEGFRDEPTRGVELSSQRRQAGQGQAPGATPRQPPPVNRHAREDSGNLGSLVADSPTEGRFDFRGRDEDYRL
ncbi:MAG: hypothetical protein M4579_004927 [Chaenotheca gracillima]|nr:MAG: hypothetical protein M4579_004927 [Chaenotheca gracillima]